MGTVAGCETRGPVDPVNDARRRSLGAWYTPAFVIEHILDETLEPVLRERPKGEALRVLDPACGDGRFLVAAGKRIRARYGIDPSPCLFGVDIDRDAVDETNRAIGALRAVVGDGLRFTSAEPFDVIVGNPPFLGQLRTRTARATAGHGYADTAALFLDHVIDLARADGGRVGLVLPQSVLATRDVATIRRKVLERAALETLWFAGEPVFDDTDVHVVVATFVRGRTQGEVRRTHSGSFTRAAARTPPTEGPWSVLVADLVGVPAVDVPDGPRLDSIATATADFRDQYYGLVGSVSDDEKGPPLITSGLIDANSCQWGRRRAKFAGVTYQAPRVALNDLSADMRAWAARRLVPKVLVATQTPVIEAVVDESGAWLPSVPVITVNGDDPWSIAAVLSSPVASAWVTARSIGTGLTANALRPTASLLAQIPLPGRDWQEATRRLRNGDLDGAAIEMMHAYGADDADLLAWWRTRVTRAIRR
jgi:hypothetical protein